MTNLFDALDFCLREIEDGGDMETALARFPEYADELRPILETSIKARGMSAPEPAPEVLRRSRAKVMQHAAELREASAAPRKQRVIPWFQRMVISFGLAAIFLLSGNGLLSASASALPGERLYPVKRGWESIRLFFIFDSEARELLKDEFENERLHEVNELIAEGRDAVIEFAGVFMQVNGATYVSGLQVSLPAGMPLPENGTAVLVTGQTNAQGFIQVISLELLPAGSVVPAGNPVEVEIEEDDAPVTETPPPAEPSEGSGNEAQEPDVDETQLEGTLNSISTSFLVVNNMTVYLVNAKVEGELCIGAFVELKGYYAPDGSFIVSEVKSSGCGGSSNGNSNSNSTNDDDSNNNSTNDSNENSSDTNDDDSNDDDSNDDDADDDNSGSGSGDDD